MRHAQTRVIACAGISYTDPKATEWCADNEDIARTRNGCNSDESCLEAGRSICDTDPRCFGVVWHQLRRNQALKICRSKLLAAKTDGWRTMMKAESNSTFA